MGWKIIEVETADNLNLFLNNIVIKRDNDKIIIPVSDIDVLLINNPFAKITTNLINELANNNVLTIICNSNYLPTCNILPIIGNYNTLKVLEGQVNWSNKLKGELWRKIISMKIDNQYSMLFNLEIDIDTAYQISLLQEEVKDFDISNREGHASKIYWHALFGINFKRHENDYINSLLNYGYTILRSYMTRSIIKKGLDPRISIYHKSFHNYFALASDLMEPFRIIIDYQVYLIYKKDKEMPFYMAKNYLINCFNNKIWVNEKKFFINKAIDMFVDAIVNQTELPRIMVDYNEWL